MKIYVTKGIGAGKTKVAAFDAALGDAGIQNYNLLYLSSVIPENTEIVISKPELKKDEHGWKLYVVVSERKETIPGKEAWAGVGWVFYKGETKGLFVHAEGESEQETITSIQETLADMMEKRGGEYEAIQYEVAGIKCEDTPVCAIVSAVYKSEGWKN